MRYYYLVKCRNCDTAYQIESSKEAFDTMKVAEERNQTIKSSSFIHNCGAHVFGVGEITGIEFREEVKPEPPIPPPNRILSEDGKKIESIKIGSDGTCTCAPTDKCPLDKMGILKRCTKEELIQAGIPIR